MYGVCCVVAHDLLMHSAFRCLPVVVASFVDKLKIWSIARIHSDCAAKLKTASRHNNNNSSSRREFEEQFQDSAGSHVCASIELKFNPPLNTSDTPSRRYRNIAHYDWRRTNCTRCHNRDEWKYRRVTRWRIDSIDVAMKKCQKCRWDSSAVIITHAHCTRTHES